MFILLNSLGFIRLPETAGKEKDDCVHFQSACNHEHSHDNLRKLIEHAEVSCSTGLSQCKACIGENPYHCREGCFHIQIIQGQQNCTHNDNSEEEQDVHGY